MGRHSSEIKSIVTFIIIVINASVRKLQDISRILPKHLVWDMDIDTLDLKKDKDIIIHGHYLPQALLHFYMT